MKLALLAYNHVFADLVNQKRKQKLSNFSINLPRKVIYISAYIFEKPGAV